MYSNFKMVKFAYGLKLVEIYRDFNKKIFIDSNESIICMVEIYKQYTQKE